MLLLLVYLVLFSPQQSPPIGIIMQIALVLSVKIKSSAASFNLTTALNAVDIKIGALKQRKIVEGSIFSPQSFMQ